MDDETREAIRDLDPSKRTTEILWREIASLKELVEVQLKAIIDRIDLEHENLVRFPTEVQEAVVQFKAQQVETFLIVTEKFQNVSVKFESIEKQFGERDIRSKQATEHSNVAISAALLSQKEIARVESEASKEAAHKSEEQITRQIDKNAEVFMAELRGMNAKIDDLKDRFAREESKVEGARASRTEGRASGQYMIAIVGLILTIVAMAVGFLVNQATK